MDKKVKKDSTACYQVLFNKPLLMTKDKYIYGFRLKEDELKHKTLSEKQLLEYVVEGIFGKCLFEAIHHGSFEGEEDLNEIWIDLNGNEYKFRKQTRLYSYDATVANMMNYRCDLVYATCENADENKNYWITDPNDYFEWKSRMDADDHKLGKNQWMENFIRIRSRRDVLSQITVVNKSENLDYSIQDLLKEEWVDKVKG